MPHRTRGAKQRGPVVGVIDGQSEARAIACIIADALPVLPDAQHYALDAARAQQPQLVRQERLAVDFNQRFGNALGQRIKASAQTARQNRYRHRRAHDCESTVAPWKSKRMRTSRSPAPRIACRRRVLSSV